LQQRSIRLSPLDMPHTSRKKRPSHAKRQEVIGEDGWTRVVTTAKKRDVDTLTASFAREGYNGWPTEASEDMTIDLVTSRFNILKRRWLLSASHAALCAALKRQLPPPLVQNVSGDTAENQHSSRSVSRTFLLGSGSFSSLHFGSTSRQYVSVLQLAVFVSLTEAIEAAQGEGLKVKMYAQEPMYNTLDKEFLKSLGIDAMPVSEGWAVLDQSGKDGHVFVYAPGAESEVAVKVFAASPAFYLGNDPRAYIETFTWTRDRASDKHHRELTSAISAAQKFVDSHDSVRLPDHNLPNYPFHEQDLYYRPLSEAGEEEDGADEASA
jgi:hypothetical protein